MNKQLNVIDGQLYVTTMEQQNVVEHVSLGDIDTGVQKAILQAVSALVVSDDQRRENQAFAAFASREAKRKVFSARFPDAASFVKALVKQSKTNDKKELLPALAVSRARGLSFSDDVQRGIDQKAGALMDAQNVPYSEVLQSFVNLNYTVTIAAWDDDTLDRLTLGVMMWFRHIRSSRQHRFKVKTMLAGQSVELSVEINRAEMDAEGGETNLEETRIVSNTIAFSVTAEVLQATLLKAKQSPLGWSEGGFLG